MSTLGKTNPDEDRAARPLRARRLTPERCAKRSRVNTQRAMALCLSLLLHLAASVSLTGTANAQAEPTPTPTLPAGANLLVWLKASVITGKNDGDTVDTWADSSNNGHDAQATPARAPVYKTNQINGLPGLQFTAASGQCMFIPSLTLPTTMSMFVVLNQTSATANQMLIEHGPNVLFNPGMLFYGRNSPMESTKRGSTSCSVPGVANWLGSGWTVAELVYGVEPTPSPPQHVYKRGTPVTNGPLLNTNVNFITGDLTNQLNIFCRDHASFFTGATLAELIIYNTNLSDTDRQAIENRLEDEYFSANAPTPTPTPIPCAGDCDGIGTVTVNEIITLVNIVLGNLLPSACANGIPNGTQVDISLIIRAVNNALGTCLTG